MTGDKELNSEAHIGESHYENVLVKCSKPENKPWADFIRLCLCPIVDQRPTMAKLLEHSWMQSVGDKRFNRHAIL